MRELFLVKETSRKHPGTHGMYILVSKYSGDIACDMKNL